MARKVLEELYGVVRSGDEVHARDVRAAVRMATQQPEVELATVYEDVLADVGSRRRIHAKNLAQRRYIDLMRANDVVFASGPAGTGKTYLAMALAVAALNRHEVSRVVLTRPAVEAGEKLGFLPGSMAEKVNPYLRPLYDALNDMMPIDKAGRLIERGVIEVAPLAFMRGRTLNDSFVILDEAQNTTSEQMKMLLTRLGFDSKAVITGDVTQIDLPGDKRSGMVEAIDKHDIVFGIGPAGTGKTYLAMAQAVTNLLQKKVSRIILARPAVEAGEKLGFLPGDLQEKVNPYLRPLYDALYDMLDTDRVERLLERGTVEIAPLAFMRGRTLNDSFVILDEAQNTTAEQMKMFLTRLGFGSKAVVTGDVTQIDLPTGRVSGLVEAMKVVSAVEGISFVHFDDRDVVRHKLVQQIVKAYEAFQSGKVPRTS